MNHKEYSSYTSSTKLLIDEAKKRKIKVTCLFPRKLLELKLNKHTEYIYNQQISKTSQVALEVCNNKYITKYILKLNGLSVMDGKVIKLNKKKKFVKYIYKSNYPIVVKPMAESGGKFVYTDITSNKELNKILLQLKKYYSEVIVEKQFFGRDFRVFATSDKVLGIIERVPANVIGDGKSNIRKLIQDKNKDSRRGELKSYEKSLMKIKIDDVVLKYLKKQKLSLKYIPKKDEIVYLRKNANISTGGDSIDYTDIAHKDIKEIAIKAIKSIPGLCYGGVDIMTKDITKNQNKSDYIVLEVNANPGFDIHHFPYNGKSRNVAKEIINIAFPETKK